MAKQEDNLEQAIKSLKSGTGLDKAGLYFPAEEMEQGRELLALAERLKALPLASAPSPARQRKYLLHKAQRTWLGWLPISKMAGLSMSLILLFTAAIGTGYAATNSVPGETLFSIKRTTEKLQLKLASSPEAKASVQVEIAKKRLNEAAKVFNDPSASPKQEKAVLTELMAETKNTIAAVSNVAKESLKAEQSRPMVVTLEDITKKQQDLLNEIAPQKLSIETESALVATKENATKVAEIKQYLEAAASEQALADLKGGTNAVTATGTISKIGDGFLQVENTDYGLLEKTVIKNGQGEFLAVGSLTAAARVNIVGYKDEGRLVAREITVLPSQEQGQVKGGITAASSSPATSTAPKILAAPSKKAEETPATSTQPELAADPNTATGSFIMEDPSPQSPF